MTYGDVFGVVFFMLMTGSGAMLAIAGFWQGEIENLFWPSEKTIKRSTRPILYWVMMTASVLMMYSGAYFLAMIFSGASVN